MIPSGIPCKFMEKLSTEIVPLAISEAIDTKKKVEIWFEDKAKVRGKEIKTTRRIEAKSIFEVSRGNIF